MTSTVFHRVTKSGVRELNRMVTLRVQLSIRQAHYVVITAA